MHRILIPEKEPPFPLLRLRIMYDETTPRYGLSGSRYIFQSHPLCSSLPFSIQYIGFSGGTQWAGREEWNKTEAGSGTLFLC